MRAGWASALDCRRCTSRDKLCHASRECCATRWRPCAAQSVHSSAALLRDFTEAALGPHCTSPPDDALRATAAPSGEGAHAPLAASRAEAHAARAPGPSCISRTVLLRDSHGGVSGPSSCGTPVATPGAGPTPGTAAARDSQGQWQRSDDAHEGAMHPWADVPALPLTGEAAPDADGSGSAADDNGQKAAVWEAAMQSRSPKLLLLLLGSAGGRPIAAATAAAAAARLAALCCSAAKPSGQGSHRSSGDGCSSSSGGSGMRQVSSRSQGGGVAAAAAAAAAESTPGGHAKSGYATLAGSQQLQYGLFLKRLRASFPCNGGSCLQRHTSQQQQQQQRQQQPLQGACSSYEAVVLLHSLALMGRCDSALVSGILDAAAATGNRTAAAAAAAAGGRAASCVVPAPEPDAWVKVLPSWQAIKLCWSLATLRYQPQNQQPSLVPALYRRTQPLLRNLGFSRASSLAWSLARLRSSSGLPPPPHWWADLEAATQLPVARQAPGDVAEMTDKGHTCEQGGREWPHRGRQHSPPPTPGQVATLLWAAGRLAPEPRPSAGWVQGLVASQGPAELARMSPREQTMLMRGLQCLRFRPPEGWAPLLLLGGARNVQGGMPPLPPGAPQQQPRQAVARSTAAVQRPPSDEASEPGAGTEVRRSCNGQQHFGPQPSDADAAKAKPARPALHKGTYPASHAPHLDSHGAGPLSGGAAGPAPSAVRGSTPVLPDSAGAAAVPLAPQQYRRPAPARPSELSQTPCTLESPPHFRPWAAPSSLAHGVGSTAGSHMGSTAGSPRMGDAAAGRLPHSRGMRHSAAEYGSLLASAARLGCPMTERGLGAAAERLQPKLWQLNPSQLLGAAASLQLLGHSPSPQLLMDWMEDCHGRLAQFTPLQLVQLLKILGSWGVAPGVPWTVDLMAAAEQQLPCFSRTRLVELVVGLASLGVKLHVGPRSALPPSGSRSGSGSDLAYPAMHLQEAADSSSGGGIGAGNSGGGEAPAYVPDAARFLCSLLRCFQSRKFRQPLPRHLHDLALSLACLCEPEAGPWDLEAAEQLQEVLLVRMPPEELQRLQRTGKTTVVEAVQKLLRCASLQ